ncbi:hypothetical protein ACFWY6_05705 [Streptomyces sp. NPDC059037]|uniref:hypothetical protein n=1 Tax=Streptomyces sp. NPDC059037 TaxID=3346710 RepID=UPI0036AA3C02
MPAPREGVVRYVIEVFRSPGGVHGNVVDEEDGEEDTGRGTPFHGWLELLSLLEPPPESAPSSATGDDSCDI